MGRLFGCLLTFVGSIISASLVLIYQNEIAALFDRAPIVATIEIGPWYPIIDDKNSENDFSDRFSDKEDLNFARVTIHNKTGKSLENTVVMIDDPDLDRYNIYDFRFAVVEKIGDRWVQVKHQDSHDRRFEVGPLPAASSSTIYIWSDRAFGYPYWSDVKVLTGDGEGVIFSKVYTVSEKSWFSSWVAIILFIAVISVSLILLFVAYIYQEFTRKMLSDEDYYLREKIRFELNPKRYSLPSDNS